MPTKKDRINRKIKIDDRKRRSKQAQEQFELK
jgi:hypothetical protein